MIILKKHKTIIDKKNKRILFLLESRAASGAITMWSMTFIIIIYHFLNYLLLLY